jgi:anti-sigma factor RsiW
MRPDAMILSAYLDGEVPQRYTPEIEKWIANDPTVRAEYEELVRLRALLRVDPPIDIEKSGRLSWIAINARVLPRRVDAWHRRVVVPLPALAAAATLVLGLASVLLWSTLNQPPVPRDYFARGSDIDVTIRVDGSDMEQVLQWLVDKNMLGEVNIQLPEQHFRVVGEPVFVKPAQYQGERSR